MNYLDDCLQKIKKDKPNLNEAVLTNNLYYDLILKLNNYEVMLTGIVAAVAIVGAVAYETNKLIMSAKTYKKCKNFKHKSTPWILCQEKIKVKLNKEKIREIKWKKYICNNSKDPEKCKKKIDAEIKKIEEDIKEKENEIKELAKEYKKQQVV